ncbi:unnamed protein product, partial [marine sediment metagenome]
KKYYQFVLFNKTDDVSAFPATKTMIKLFGLVHGKRGGFFLMEGAQAGMNASLKGMERLREYNERLDLYFESNLNIKVAILEKGYDPAEFILKKVEIEALKLIINGLGEKLDGLLELGPQYFRFEDTRELFSILKKEISRLKEGNKKVNFPIKISSGVLENKEVRKLYNFILFSELHYSDDEIDPASTEILNNLKKIHLSEEIEYVRKKMLEYEDAKRGSSDEEIEKLDRKYDNLYQRLIKLEQEKQKLGIINI